jgi:septal ring factor EnvC (AmiA/AmiB activator)
MNSPEYDAREVLQKFIATLDVSADAVIRDAADLAHPKDVIKSVLQHCIKTIEGADERTFLRTAYLSLGSYQDLTDDERKALSALRQVGPPAPPESKLQEEQARQIREFAIPLQAVTDRLKSETAILTQELKLLPGQD